MEPFDKRNGPIAEPPLLRFGLRQLFLFTGLTCLLSALLAVTNGQQGMVLVVGVLVVGAHVLGTTIGTRLRARTDDSLELKPRVKTPAHIPTTKVGEYPAQAHSQWRSIKTSALWLWILVACGGLAGWIGGAVLLAALPGGEIRWPGIVIGSLSTALLGAWLAFMATNFVGISRNAWKAAMRANDPRD